MSGNPPEEDEEYILARISYVGFVDQLGLEGVVVLKSNEGPISLQSVVTVDLDFVVYDVSLRVPGNPIMATTSPYAKYYYGHTMGVGRRIAMEIKDATRQRKLPDIVT